jgi:hypothetical protein
VAGGLVHLVVRDVNNAALAIKDGGQPGRNERGRIEVAAFLDEEARKHGRLVVAASHNEAQRLGWRLTQDVGIHWIWAGTTARDLDVLRDHFHVAYIVTRRNQKDGGAPAFDPSKWRERAHFSGGFVVLEPGSAVEVQPEQRVPQAHAEPDADDDERGDD